MSGFEGMVSLRPAAPVEAPPQASLGELAGATFDETLASNPTNAIVRRQRLQDAYEDNRITDATAARGRLKAEGLEGRLLIPDQGIPQAALDTLIERKRDEVKREEVFARAPSGPTSMGVKLAVELGGSLLDPLNVASAFMPVVGETRYAQLLGKTAGAAGLLRRTAVRAGVGAAEGALGTAAIEPLVYSSKQLDQADYEMGDSLTNIAFGGVFGAGLHVSGGAIGDLWRYAHGSAGDVAARIDATTRAQALKTAIAQAAGGERVNVDPLLKLDPSATPPAIPHAEGLGAADQAIESRFREKVSGDVEGAMAEYAKLPESNGGRILNTDIARELSPDYLADRTKSAPVHEPASWLVKEMYRRRLAEAEPGGMVVFSAGGTGAGKTTGLRMLGLDKELVYDTNMASLKGAVDKIEQALEAQQKVHVVYTYRDPVDALTAGALPRAMRQEAEHGTGRTVPLNEHEKTHVGSRDVVEKLARRYADDDRVEFSIIDNTKGKGGETAVALADLPRIDYNSLGGRLDEALAKQHDSGAISDAVNAGFQRQAGLRPEVSERELEQVHGPLSGSPEEGRAEAVSLSAVREAATAPKLSTVADEAASASADAQLRETPDTPRTTEEDIAAVDAETTDELARVKESGIEVPEDELAAFDELVKDADTYSKAARAAVVCGLRHP